MFGTSVLQAGTFDLCVFKQRLYLSGLFRKVSNPPIFPFLFFSLFLSRSVTPAFNQ